MNAFDVDERSQGFECTEQIFIDITEDIMDMVRQLIKKYDDGQIANYELIDGMYQLLINHPENRRKYYVYEWNRVPLYNSWLLIPEVYFKTVKTFYKVNNNTQPLKTVSIIFSFHKTKEFIEIMSDSSNREIIFQYFNYLFRFNEEYLIGVHDIISYIERNFEDVYQYLNYDLLFNELIATNSKFSDNYLMLISSMVRSCVIKKHDNNENYILRFCTFLMYNNMLFNKHIYNIFDILIINNECIPYNLIRNFLCDLIYEKHDKTIFYVPGNCYDSFRYYPILTKLLEYEKNYSENIYLTIIDLDKIFYYILNYSSFDNEYEMDVLYIIYLFLNKCLEINIAFSESHRAELFANICNNYRVLPSKFKPCLVVTMAEIISQTNDLIQYMPNIIEFYEHNLNIDLDKDSIERVIIAILKLIKLQSKTENSDSYIRIIRNLLHIFMEVIEQKSLEVYFGNYITCFTQILNNNT